MNKKKAEIKNSICTRWSMIRTGRGRRWTNEKAVYNLVQLYNKLDPAGYTFRLSLTMEEVKFIYEKLEDSPLKKKLSGYVFLEYKPLTDEQ